MHILVHRRTLVSLNNVVVSMLQPLFMQTVACMGIKLPVPSGQYVNRTA